MKKTIIRIENVIILILVAISLFAIMLTKNNTKVAAATPIITVNKNASISVYVTGIGVELINSTPFTDEYSYEANTEFTIIAVNETKIFTNYIITDSTSTSEITTQRYTSTKTGSFSISVEGRSTVTADKGSYMGDRFLLEDDEDLIALQEIVKAGKSPSTTNTNLQSFYNQFLGTTTINETNYNKIVNGYFLVANNISMFSSLVYNGQTYYFTGIGTTNNPFNGVICGNVDGISSQIVTVITKDNLTSSDGINSFGFFGTLGSNAVVRNLKFATSIGVKGTSSNQISNLYVGGVAGYATDALFVNVASTANISVDLPDCTTNVYSGIFVGEANGLNIESISKLYSVRDHASLTINTKGNNYAGVVAGRATDMYIKGLDLDLSGLSIILRNQDSTNNVYGGLLFGYLNNASKIVMEDINVSAKESFRVEAYSDIYTGTTYTGAYTGGIAGYCDADALMILGNITLANYGEQECVISSHTMDADSKSNVYSGGLFGYIDSLYTSGDDELSYVVGNDEFKDRISEINVDGKIAYNYNPVFTGNISISSIQNGLGDGLNYGKAVAGGLVGKGLIDINGIDGTSPTELVLTKEGKLKIDAVQSRIAMHQKIADYISNGNKYNPKTSNLMMLSDYEHCVSSIVFGLISENSLDYLFENINIYAEQAISTTEREIGSRANGHILNSGFISYSDGQTINNVHLYYNNCKITSNSLSYETKAYINNASNNGNSGYDYDNAHVGGIVGSYTNSLNKAITISDVSIEGVEWNYLTKTIGTKLKLYSIQNTIPGGGDGRGENYIGGIIGKIYRANIDNALFRGSSTSEDYIRMSGHEDPDSAFCGGIVGFIKGFGKVSYDDYINLGDTEIGASVDGTINIINCSVIDTEIYGEATITDFSEPDIYVGGIIGASYVNGKCSTEFNFNNLSVIRCTIKALGNEKTIVYCAGVLGGATWTSNKYAISNCFVSDTIIEATTRPGSDTTAYDKNKHAKAYAAGMCSLALNANITFSNNAIIESQIISSNYAGGLFSYGNTAVSIQTKTYTNNYSNALLDGIYVYGIAPSQTSLSSNNYYHLQNTGLSSASGIGDAIDFSKQQVTTTYDTVVDNINRDTNYMDYQLEYDNGYQVNTGSADVKTYEYKRIITSTEYNALPSYSSKYYLFYGAIVKYYPLSSYSGNLINPTTGSTMSGQWSSITVNGTGYKIPFTWTAGCSYKFSDGVKQLDYEVIVNGNTGYIIGEDIINNNLIENVKYKEFYTLQSDGRYCHQTVLSQNEYNALSANEKTLFEEVVTVTGNSTVDNTISFVGDSNLAYVDKLHLWVNFKGVGNTISYDKNLTREELHSAGWFDLGSIIVYNKEEGVLTTPPTITDEKVSYVVDDAEYLYDNGVFKNKNYPFDEVSRNGYEITDSYNYVVKVHDDIPSWKLTFKIAKNISLLEEFYEVGSDSSETLIDTSSGTVNTYGSYSFSFITTDTDKIYTLVFNPNVNIEQDAKVVIKFRLGNSLTLDSKIFTLDIKENKFTLVGVKYAEYSPALNNYKYPEVITDDINTSYLEGQYRNDIAYCLPKGQIIKFIPIFKRQNDLVVKLYDDEKYIELVSFNNGVKSSGEWVVSGSGGSITITYTASNTFEFNYTVSSKNQVTYSVIGMTPEAIPYTSPGTNYEFICYLNNGYSGHPKNVTIEIGSTIYSYANNTLGDILEVYDINGNVVSWDMENTYYRLLLDGSKINSDVHISIEFPLVYTVRFDLQTEGFNGTGKKEETVYKIEDGTKFNEFFNDDRDLEIKNWIKDNTIFGYAFTGFYLVSESNTHSSYGINYEDILKMTNFEVHTSFTFYARWSFLVELVEAPGTTITPSFKDSFMTEINPDDPNNTEYDDLVSKTIRVPLNNKEGYVFTVEKDPTYIGEAEVAAYIITKNGDRQVVTEVTVEKYNEDMYLYHIPSEAITGYLMIVTSISNSGFIVGENTATVTEEILPEDGIFTYKYVVNHLKNDTEKTYLYDNGKVAGSESNLSLNKNFVLYFYEQGYDQINLVTTKDNYNLPNGTYVEVYYQKFVNQVMTERIVATKKINDSSTHYISLKDFYTIDYQKTSDFKNETFNEFLGNNESVSEVYYIVITPPNGYRQHDNEIKNFIVEGGYENVNCYEAVLTEAEYNTISSLLNSNNIFAYNANGTKRIEITKDQYNKISDSTIKAKFEFVPFIKGIRNGQAFVNKPLEDEKEADFIKYESSRQVKVYSVTPSRITTNTKSGTTYTFTDNKEYQVFNVKYDSEATITLTGDGKKLSLAPNATQDTLISSVLPFNLVSLKFSAGYNTGKIEVYGINGSTRQLMKTVEIDSIEYKDYEVSFIPIDEPTRYNQFELKVIAADEIRLSSLSIVSLTNGMTYSLDDFSKYHQGNIINFSNQIVNDQRHDGKTFMIAVQFKKDGNIVDVPEGVKINVNGTLYNAFVDQDVYGRVTAYFNMSKILDGLSGNSFDYSIECPSGYTYAVQLIEAINPNKPAMSEVRGTIE